ncbi:MAG: ThiF family adenylyltransferase [Chitinophagales bacterium]|nr:ThiF family adenylyltransferase [Chitinophagales bacterium]
MAPLLFSSTLTPFEGEIENKKLNDSIAELSSSLHKSLKKLIWDDNHIAICVKIPVELPPLGNAGNIDIRPNEPVIIAFDKNNYPSKAPKVFPDRTNFPKNQLAHLYVAKKNRPPGFCLIRGNIDEWFANKQIKDLLTRTSNWLRDAACGELTEDSQQFEPIRLEGYRGEVIYPYDKLHSIVEQNLSFKDKSNFAVIFFENIANDDDPPSFKLLWLVNNTEYSTALTLYVESIKKLLEQKTFKVKKYQIGYLIWSNDNREFSNYDTNLPSDWNTLKAFCDGYSIDISGLEEFIAESVNFFHEIPVITAIRRTKPIIGFSGKLEFINYYIELSDDDKTGKAINNIPVFFQSHSEPLTSEKAALISGTPIHLHNASVVGCGALGSKVIMHFIRNGVKDLTIFDNDYLSPHNLVRHALLPEYEGMNKATALRNAAKSMFRNEDFPILAIPTSPTFAVNSLEVVLKNGEWLLDFTASENFFNSLVSEHGGEDGIRICSGSISDHGKLGVLYVEGKSRNPRIDDLKLMSYAQYKKVPLISDWLRRESVDNNGNLNLHVGVGCNSETIVLSDDIISTHASYFSQVIKKESQQAQSELGRIFICSVNSDQSISIGTSAIEIQPMLILPCVNDSSWQVRMSQHVLVEMKKEMGLAMPHETGGVFIGSANYKTKTLHVVDLIKAPPDSSANPVCFFRGVQGLSEEIESITNQTGNQLGYIGEWHTHPFGPNGMSGVDRATAKAFKKEFSSLTTPLPVFLTILTPSGILPFVF